MTVDDRDHLDKALKIAAQVQNRINKIKAGVEKFQHDMLDLIAKGQEAVTNAAGRSQKAIDNELQKLQKRYDDKHKAAQEWVDKQLEKVKDWMNKQIDDIQQELKESAARVELQILECSTGKDLPKEAVDSLISSIPDIQIPRPEIPQIIVPKPEFPYPNINLVAIAQSLMDAAGVNELATTAARVVGTDLASTGKNMAQSKLNI